MLLTSILHLVFFSVAVIILEQQKKDKEFTIRGSYTLNAVPRENGEPKLKCGANFGIFVLCRLVKHLILKI